MEGLEGSPDLVASLNPIKPTKFTFSKFDHFIKAVILSFKRCL